MAVAKAEPGKTRIGWIGTGVMGRWMCQHVMTKGYSGDGLQPQQGQGPAAARPGADVRRHARRRWPSESDVVFAIVGFPKDVREVFLGPNGALAGQQGGRRSWWT